MVCENQVAVFAAGVPARLAEQHLDQIPMHAAVVIAQATGQRRHVMGQATSVEVFAATKDYIPRLDLTGKG